MSAVEEMGLTERQRHWPEHIQACKTSGKTTAEYAAKHNFAAQAMYAGKKTLIRKGVCCPQSGWNDPESSVEHPHAVILKADNGGKSINSHQDAQ